MISLLKEQELVSPGNCKKVAYLDARALSSSTKRYVEENSLSYYLLINTWLLFTRKYAGIAYYELLDWITTYGLISAVETLTSDALKLVKDDADTLSGLGLQIVRGVESPLQERLALTAHEVGLPDLAIGRSHRATALQIMRYAKRFSPLDADKISEKSIKEFLFVERENRRFSLREYSRFENGGGLNREIIAYVKAEVEKLYDWEEICRRIDLLEACDFELPPGSTRTGNNTIADKLAELFAQSEDALNPIFGVRPVRLQRPLEYTPGASEVLAVPKSFKAARIIAKEDCTLNAHSRAIEKIFRDMDRLNRRKATTWRSGLHLDQQELNQHAAYISASVDHAPTFKYATLDASHASDYITHRLVQEVLPYEYLRRVDHLIPREYRVDGKVYPKWMHSTSGHELTFRHESIIYYCICAAATQFYLDFFRSEIGSERTIRWLRVYGDDVAIDSRFALIAIEFLEKCGLHMNVDKTYIEGPYRESCGKEYFEFYDVSSLYYPRFPIHGSIDSNHRIIGTSRSSKVDPHTGEAKNDLQMLIALEKKFADWCYEAMRFVKSVILEICPDMTTSPIGTPCADVWDYAEKGPLSPSPALYSVETFQNYAMHTRRRTKRIGVKEGREFQTVQHLMPFVNYNGKDGATKFRDQWLTTLIRWYQYQEFLKKGPQYASEYDRRLGISSPPMKLAAYCSKGVVDWKMVR